MGLGKGGFVILASCKYPFIRVQENLVQHPNDNILNPSIYIFLENKLIYLKHRFLKYLNQNQKDFTQKYYIFWLDNIMKN